MSERNGTVVPENPGTMPIELGDGATATSVAAPATSPTAAPVAPARSTGKASPSTGKESPSTGKGSSSVGDSTEAGPPTAAGAPATAEAPAAPGPHATAPVTARPKPRMPRRGPLTVMGPWAPVAGGLLGLFLGLVVVLFLAGVAVNFEDRLALAFTVLGLGMLGTAGTLLADEVRMLRQQAREAAVRPQWVQTTAGLLNGLTPARLLLGASAFVLFLAAFVGRG